MDVPISGSSHDTSGRTSMNPLGTQPASFWRTLIPTWVVMLMSSVSIALHEIYWSRAMHQLLWEYIKVETAGKPVPHGGELAQAFGFIAAVGACLIGLF